MGQRGGGGAETARQRQREEEGNWARGVYVSVLASFAGRCHDHGHSEGACVGHSVGCSTTRAPCVA